MVLTLWNHIDFLEICSSQYGASIQNQIAKVKKMSVSPQTYLHSNGQPNESSMLDGELPSESGINITEPSLQTTIFYDAELSASSAYL